MKLPASLPSGEYLIRAEHIALHSAQSSGGAQFYISCGQLNVTGGGAGTPGPLVAFPGAYKATDPGIMINIYYPVVSVQKKIIDEEITNLINHSQRHTPNQGQLFGKVENTGIEVLTGENAHGYMKCGCEAHRKVT